MSSGYKYISHTADVRLKTPGESLPDLFAACLTGMNELLKPVFLQAWPRKLLWHIKYKDVDLVVETVHETGFRGKLQTSASWCN